MNQAAEVTRKRSKLQPIGSDPAECLALAFADMLAYAREQCTHDDLTVGVHSFRKSVRRARSLVKLIRPAVSKRAYRQLNADLRDAVQATSVLRDVDVTEALLEDYVGPSGTAEALTSWRNRLADGARPSTELIQSTLLASAQALAPIPAAFAATVADLTPKGFSQGLGEGYRRARLARREAIRSDFAEDPVHTWRKRVKEVRYQLELLTSPVAVQLNHAFGSLAQDLGRVTDWTVLEGRLAHVQGLDPEACALLNADFSHRHAKDVREVAAASAWLFGLKPASYLEVLCVGLDYTSPFGN